VASLKRVAASQDVVISTDRSRVVDGPADEGTWTVAPAGDGGVCAATSRVAFCGLSSNDVASGKTSVTTYPRDTFLSVDKEKGTAIVQPSDGPGTRTGIAPEGTTEVVVTVDGEARQSALVERGLYKVAVPPQNTDAIVEFRASGKILASRPAAG